MDIQQDFTPLIGTGIVSDWLTLTQERISAFAAASDDQQWIHTNPERARDESPFGTTVAHGFLVLSLFSHFMTKTVNLQAMRLGVNYGLNRVRFVTPVPAGSRIRAHFKLLSVEPIAAIQDLAGEQLTWAVVIEKEGIDKPACVAEWITRRYL